MKKLTYLFSILIIASCSNNSQQVVAENNSKNEKDTAVKVDSTTKPDTVATDTPDIIYTDCIIEGDHSFDIDKIIKDLQLTLDTAKKLSKYDREYIVSNIGKLKKARTNKLLLFPYSEVDSAIYVHYKMDLENPVYPDSPFLEKNFRFATILCKEKIDAILGVVNNSNNFMNGEVGTPIPTANILFYNKNKLVGRMVICNNYGQTFYYPKNELCKYGVLNMKGTERLWEINLNK